MFRMFWHIFISAAFALVLPGMALAAPDIARVTYKDGKSQAFQLNRDASLIRRVMFDSEKPDDKLIVTYRDDTHQVFGLKQKIANIKKMVFDGGDRVESPPVKPRAANPSVQAATGVFVPTDNKLGSVWQVTERCGATSWEGIWTRRGGTNIFDAEWKANTGDRYSGIVEFRDLTAGRVTLYRSDKGGTYQGTISIDGKRVINGWATWYTPNCTAWYAVIN